MTWWRRVVTIIVAVAAVAACSGDADDDTAAPTAAPSTTTTTATTVPPTSAPPETTTTTTAAPSTTVAATTVAPATSAPATTVDDGELAGEPIELFARPGQVWSVVGVDRDDVLNVRCGPGIDEEIIATLAPDADDVVTTGAARNLPASIWYEVEVAGGTGWVNSFFLALPGVVDDITSQVVADLGGIPTAETLVDLGELVAGTRASTDVESRIVVSVAPTVGDLGEITMDVLGFADDAAAGERLHVFAQEDGSGETFSLRSVEATILCFRGVSEGGLCA
ncbi:MAG: hypothetical protein AAFZ07_14730 [Actinomycetota bacterium]